MNLRHGLAAAFPHFNRLRTLCCAGTSIQGLSKSCNHPVPLLEALHILPYGSSGSSVLPTLLNGDFLSLRHLYVDHFNPFPNSHFHGPSSAVRISRL